jgi:hypothetical protein
MKHLLSVTVTVLLIASSAGAQTSIPAVPTQFQVLILPTTGDPLTVAPITTQTTSIGPTQNCGIDPATLTNVPGPSATNPVLFALDDPFTAGRACRMSFPTGLMAGNYRWAGVLIAPSCNPTGTQVISPCPGPRSVGQPPFSIVNPNPQPPAPMGLRFIQ